MEGGLEDIGKWLSNVKDIIRKTHQLTCSNWMSRLNANSLKERKDLQFMIMLVVIVI